MRILTAEEGLEIRSSLGYVKDFYKSPDNKQEPLSNYNLLLDMYENDAVLTTAVDTSVDVATSSGYHFIGENPDQILEAQKLFDDTLDLDQVLPNLFTQLLIYGDAFLELRRFNGQIKELHPLETTEMYIRYDDHGKVLGYRQVTTTFPDKYQEFSEENIIHIALKRIGSGVYSRNPLKSIMREYSAKKRGVYWVSQLFTNLPPRLVWVLKNSSSTQTKQFIDNLKIAKNNPHKDIVALGDTEVQEVGMSKLDSGLIDLLNYLRQEILMITKVPPIWIGIPDDSNRSNSEAQIRSFETRIKSIQKKFESAVNKKLMFELGFEGVKLRFNPFSLIEEKAVIENAVQMKALGVAQDSIENYLLEHGLDIELMTVEEQAANMQLLNPMAQEGSSPDGKPGEKQKPKPSQKPGLDQNGASKEGKRKMDEANAKVRSTNFGEYPYTL